MVDRPVVVSPDRAGSPVRSSARLPESPGESAVVPPALDTMATSWPTIVPDPSSKVQITRTSSAVTGPPTTNGPDVLHRAADMVLAGIGERIGIGAGRHPEVERRLVGKRSQERGGEANRPARQASTSAIPLAIADHRSSLSASLPSYKD
jgi:hypothetical protein